MQKHNSCGCSQPETCECFENMAPAMAYVPWQKYHETYKLDKALCAGTIFPELNKPFYGRRGGGRS